MRIIRNLNANRNLDFEKLNAYINEEVVRVYTYESKSNFPAIGKVNCIYLDKSDKYQSYAFNETIGEYKPINEFNVILGGNNDDD